MRESESKQTVRLPQVIFGLATAAVLVAGLSVPAMAVNYGGGSVEGYAADSRIDTGTIVQLAGESSDKVKVATKTEQQNMFGVTVDRNQLPMAVTRDLENEVFVAVSGVYNVLVTTETGAIEAGDYITLSSVNGVGMKAGTEDVTVFGRAGAAFDGKGVNLGTMQLEADNGEVSSVTIGSVPVAIDIRHNPNDKSTEVDVPEVLKRVGQAIAEKEVSPIRIYLSMAITATSLISAIVVLYSGVKNGVISIGRNPMSKKSIFRALLEIILTSFAVLVIGMFAVYLLLRL